VGKGREQDAEALNNVQSGAEAEMQDVKVI